MERWINREMQFSPCIYCIKHCNISIINVLLGQIIKWSFYIFKNYFQNIFKNWKTHLIFWKTMKMVRPDRFLLWGDCHEKCSCLAASLTSIHQRQETTIYLQLQAVTTKNVLGHCLKSCGAYSCVLLCDSCVLLCDSLLCESHVYFYVTPKNRFVMSTLHDLLAKVCWQSETTCSRGVGREEHWHTVCKEPGIGIYGPSICYVSAEQMCVVVYSMDFIL